MTTAVRPGGVPRLAWIAWLLVCVIWGTTYLAIKIALDTVPPFLLAGFRYVTGGIVLALLLAARGHRLPPPRTWLRLAVLGFFMLLFGNGGVVWGEQYVPTGLSAVLIGMTPFWMVGVDALFEDGTPLRARQWCGLTIGFAGIVLLVWPDIAAAGTVAHSFVYGIIGLQLACAGWAIGSAYTRRHVMPKDAVASAALQMIFGGLWLFALGTVTGEWPHLSFTIRTASAILYLSLAGSVVAFAAFSYALQYLDVAVVGLYTYVNPIIAVALGTMVLGEPFHVRMLAGGAVIAAGIAIVGPVRKPAVRPEDAMAPVGE